MSLLPTDYAERKALPVYTYLMKYFPLAFLETVRVAVDGDKQHGNTGQEIHWAREKSTDQMNTALRHIMDYGTGVKRDTDGRAHLAKAIWRLSAQLQLDLEAEQAPAVVNIPNNQPLGQPPRRVIPQAKFAQLLAPPPEAVTVGCKVAYNGPEGPNMNMIRRVVKGDNGGFEVWGKHNYSVGSWYRTLEDVAKDYIPVQEQYELTA